MADTAIFDVDGTLVDTNYQHALAWFRAFRRYGITRPMWRIHRGIGMGGDTFVPEVGGPDVEQVHGDDLRQAWVEESDQLIGEIQPASGSSTDGHSGRAVGGKERVRHGADPVGGVLTLPATSTD